MKIHTELINALIRPNPPLKPTRQPMTNGVTVKQDVSQIKSINPIVSNIIYSPIHYTLTLTD
jgi:hypothetical protein